MRPFSPVSRRFSSSSSVRILPPARTFQGASARPKFQCKGGEVDLINVVGTFRSSHGDYIALEGAFQDAPCALVDNEWSQCVVSCVLVGF